MPTSYDVDVGYRVVRGDEHGYVERPYLEDQAARFSERRRRSSSSSPAR
jgi:hypothetical protein